MGLSQMFGRKKRRKGGRGPAKSADERLKLEKLQFLRDLRRSDPELYRQLMIDDVRRHFGGAPEDPIGQMVKQIKQLREVGLLQDTEDVGKDSFLRDVLNSEAGKAAAAAAMALLMDRLQPAAAAPMAASNSAPSLAGQAQNPQRLTNGHHDPEDEMQALISRLSAMTPEQAARYLHDLGRQQPDGSMLVTLLQVPDDQLDGYLARVAQRFPMTAGLVQFLRTRWDWTLATVRELRQLAGTTATGTSTGGL